MKSVLILAMCLPLAPVAAQIASAPRKPSEAAQTFNLDLGTLPVDDTVTATVPAEAPAGPAKAPEPAAPAGSGLFTLDTPIELLIADPRAKAVLDKDLPGLSDDENLAKFRALSLRAFQPMTGGQLTDALLDKTAADLAAIKPRPTGKKRFDSR